MRIRSLCFSAAIFGLFFIVGRTATAQHTSGATAVTLDDGSTACVESGELQVRESRRRPTARRITNPYYRLTSTISTPLENAADFPPTIDDMKEIVCKERRDENRDA